LQEEICGRRYFAYLSVQDAYPLAVLESLAAGALPLVYNIPGTDEIVESWGGLMVPPGKTEELVPVLLQLERDAADRADPLKDRPAFSRHFGAENIQHAINGVLHLVSGQG